MDDRRFDRLARALVTRDVVTRRRLGGLGAGFLIAFGLGADVTAKKKRKHKKKKNKKPAFQGPCYPAGTPIAGGCASHETIRCCSHACSDGLPGQCGSRCIIQAGQPCAADCDCYSMKCLNGVCQPYVP